MIIDHTKNIIEVKDVSFAYKNESVLENISFAVHKGDYVGIIGPNGAGKTTLIKIMLSLLKPKTGSVEFFGKKLKDFKDWSRIGYVAQKVTNFDANFPATACEVVKMGFYKKNKGSLKKIESALNDVGILDLKNKMIGDLSGGQQQRVFLARALAGNPEIIFLDEPTTGIDKKSQDDFYRIIKNLNEKSGITIILVTHDIERITKEAMHIICVDKTLVCHTSPEEFLRDSLSENIFGQNVKIITHHHHN